MQVEVNTVIDNRRFESILQKEYIKKCLSFIRIQRKLVDFLIDKEVYDDNDMKEIDKLKNICNCFIQLTNYIK